MDYKKIREKEKYFYEKIGVCKVKELVLKLFLPKFGSREENNYHLKKNNGLQDLKDQKKMLWINGTVHGTGLISLFFLTSSFPSFVLVLIGIIQAYLVMVQRYNYIRIEEAIEKHQDHEKKKIKNLKINILEKDARLKLHRVELYEYQLGHHVTLSESLDDILDQASYYELLYYKKIFTRLEEENQKGYWYSEDLDVPSLNGRPSEKILSIIYSNNFRYNIKDKNQSS